MAKSNTGKPNRAKPARLGRGLSSLMAQPVPVEPPADAPNTPPANAEDPSDPSTSNTPAPNTHPTGDAHPRLGETPRGDTPHGGSAPPPDDPPDPDQPDPAHPTSERIQRVPIDRIQPNRHQPRQSFDEAALQELADSIRASGLMQPPIVRPLPTPPTADTPPDSADGPRYEIVAGERRWRAARLAGLEQMPVIIRELDDRQSSEWALVENLQREDLNPIDRAEALRGLIDRYGLSHEDIAERCGVNRVTITNSLRLLNLATEVRETVRQGLLSAGAAKVLVGLSDPQVQTRLAKLAVRDGWSVRKLEQAVRRGQQGADAKPTRAREDANKSKTNHLADLEQQITEALGARVRIRPGRKKGAGTLQIDFHDIDQFDALMERLGVSTEG